MKLIIQDDVGNVSKGDICISTVEMQKVVSLLRSFGLQIEATQHRVQRTVAQPCEMHNMEFCSECYPAVVVDFNRR